MTYVEEMHAQPTSTRTIAAPVTTGPPRRDGSSGRGWLIGGVVVAALLVVGIAVGANDDDAPAASTPPSAARQVTYTVGGTATAATVNWRALSGKQDAYVHLPLTDSGAFPAVQDLTLTTIESGLYVFINVQASGPGTVTCSLSIDGKVVDSASASTGATSAICTGTT